MSLLRLSILRAPQAAVRTASVPWPERRPGSPPRVSGGRVWVQVALCTGGSAGGCVLTPVRKTLGSGDKLSPGCPLLRQRQNCRPHCPELWAWVWALSNRGHHSSAPARPAGPSAAQDGSEEGGGGLWGSTRTARAAGSPPGRVPVTAHSAHRLPLGLGRVGEPYTVGLPAVIPKPPGGARDPL